MNNEARGARSGGGAAPLLIAALILATAGPAMADATEDARIGLRLENRLAGQVGLDLADVRWTVREGTVDLEGTVGSLGDLTRLERLVTGIVGVATVRNRLGVRPSSRPDGAIGQEIRSRLERRMRFRRTPVQVTVVGGRAILEGEVERALDRRDAADIAAAVEGVVSMDNRLTVRTEGSLPPGVLLSRVRSLLTNPLTFGVIRNLQVEVRGPVVVLRGAVLREADRARASELVLGIAGVGRVENLLSVTGS